MNGDSGLLTLPKLYTRSDIAVYTEELWEHLKSISNEVVQKDDV